jgi:hypothetical protein
MWGWGEHALPLSLYSIKNTITRKAVVDGPAGR